MPFNHRLDILMKTLGISNSRLSRALSLDASLISRWRTGSRIPTKNSTHILAIASYFASHAKTSFQKEVLLDLMGMPTDKRLDNISNLSELLYSWLCDESLPNTNLVSSFLDRFDRKEDRIGNFYNLNKLSIYPSGMTIKHEVFYGIKGKQNSVIRFLTEILESNKKSTLLLYSDENIEWFTGDRVFLLNFIRLLKEVILNGNKIKIIHTISRNMAEMFAAIEFWLPLYTTGAVEPYYCPKYRDHYFKRTMFIAPGIAAVMSTTLSGCEHNAANFFYTDIDFIDSIASEFNEYLNICKPLMQIYTSTNLHKYHDYFDEFERNEGDSIFLSSSLSSVTMPDELFHSILKREGIDEDLAKKMLSIKRERQILFKTNIKKYNYTEIILLPTLTEILEGKISIELPNLSESISINYTPIEFMEHLKNIIKLLESIDKYNFFIYRKSIHKNLQLYVKDEVGVIVTKKEDPLTIFTFNQNNMTNAFYCYMEDFINGIPQTEKEKNNVIIKLKDLGAQLSKYHNI